MCISEMTHRPLFCPLFPLPAVRWIIMSFRPTRTRLNIRHWPPAEPSDIPTECDGSSRDSFGSDEAGAQGRPDNGPNDPPGRGSASGSESGSGEVAAAPRAVILAGSLSELPWSMRVGSAVVFTDLSSPEAWRYGGRGGDFLLF